MKLPWTKRDAEPTMWPLCPHLGVVAPTQSAAARRTLLLATASLRHIVSCKAADRLLKKGVSVELAARKRRKWARGLEL
jgi:hypothetical protein